MPGFSEYYERNRGGVPEDYNWRRQQMLSNQPMRGQAPQGGELVPDNMVPQGGDNPYAPQGFNPGQYQGMAQGQAPYTPQGQAPQYGGQQIYDKGLQRNISFDPSGFPIDPNGVPPQVNPMPAPQGNYETMNDKGNWQTQATVDVNAPKDVKPSPVKSEPKLKMDFKPDPGQIGKNFMDTPKPAKEPKRYTIDDAIGTKAYKGFTADKAKEPEITLPKTMDIPKVDVNANFTKPPKFDMKLKAPGIKPFKDTNYFD